MLDLTVRRTGDRVWWTELEDLLSEGYKIVLCHPDAAVAEGTSCDRCGHHRMEYRGSPSRRGMCRSSIIRSGSSSSRSLSTSVGSVVEVTPP